MMLRQPMLHERDAEKVPRAPAFGDDTPSSGETHTVSATRYKDTFVFESAHLDLVT
ncbi:hypothetical protein SAMN03159496_05835 [Rhizobium sp. NFR07]|nr:hypothetical protein SAMN03159496_05835 [Rhizobium sp. NFR07]